MNWLLLAVFSLWIVTAERLLSAWNKEKKLRLASEKELQRLQRTKLEIEVDGKAFVVGTLQALRDVANMSGKDAIEFRIHTKPESDTAKEIKSEKAPEPKAEKADSWKEKYREEREKQETKRQIDREVEFRAMDEKLAKYIPKIPPAKWPKTLTEIEELKKAIRFEEQRLEVVSASGMLRPFVFQVERAWGFLTGTVLAALDELENREKEKEAKR